MSYNGNSIINALLWLSSLNSYEKIDKNVFYDISPKLSNYLLPTGIALKIRQRVEKKFIPRMVSNFIVKTVFRIYLILKFICKKSIENPRTMEIKCSDSMYVEHSNYDEYFNSCCLVASMESYFNVVLEIANNLIDSGEQAVLLVPFSASGWSNIDKLNNSVKVLYLEEFFSFEIFASYKQNLKFLSDSWDDTVEKIFTGPFLLKDLLAVNRKQLKYSLVDLISQLNAYQLLSQEILKLIKPKNIIVVRLKRFTENSITSQAKEKKIPVYVVNHGHIGADWDDLALGDLEKKADGVIVWNNIQKNILLKNNPFLDTSNVHAIGGVQWDRAIKYYGENKLSKRIKIRSKISNDLNASLTEGLWITITIDIYVKTMLPDILRSLDDGSPKNIFIKVRPGESEIDYKKSLPHDLTYSPIFFDSEYSFGLFDLLFASDLVFTFLSTTNIDSVSVGTPVVTVLLSKKTKKIDRYIYLEKYGLPIANSKKNIKMIVRSYTYDEKYRKVLSYNTALAATALLKNYPEGNSIDKLFGLINR